MPQPYEALGERIRKARSRAGFKTGSEFAERLNLRAEQVSRFEVGRRRPNLDLLTKMAEVCKVSLDWLATGRGQGPSAESDSDDAAPTGTEG